MRTNSFLFLLINLQKNCFLLPPSFTFSQISLTLKIHLTSSLSFKKKKSKPYPWKAFFRHSTHRTRAPLIVPIIVDTGLSIHTLMDSLSPWNSFVFPRVSPTHSLSFGSSASYAFEYEGCGRPGAGRKKRKWESGTAGASWVVELTRVLRPSSTIDIAGLLSSTFVPTKLSPQLSFPTRFFPPYRPWIHARPLSLSHSFSLFPQPSRSISCR